MKPFRVNWEWAEYAHGPGADSGYPIATSILNTPLAADGKSILLTDPSQVFEIVDVAGLYLAHSHVQEDERLWFRAYPASVIKRGKAWLEANKRSTP